MKSQLNLEVCRLLSLVIHQELPRHLGNSVRLTYMEENLGEIVSNNHFSKKKWGSPKIPGDLPLALISAIIRWPSIILSLPTIVNYGIHEFYHQNLSVGTPKPTTIPWVWDKISPIFPRPRCLCSNSFNCSAICFARRWTAAELWRCSRLRPRRDLSIMSQTWDSQSHDLLVEQVSQSMGQDSRIYGGSISENRSK